MGSGDGEGGGGKIEEGVRVEEGGGSEEKKREGSGWVGKYVD